MLWGFSQAHLNSFVTEDTVWRAGCEVVLCIVEEKDLVLLAIGDGFVCYCLPTPLLEFSLWEACGLHRGATLTVLWSMYVIVQCLFVVTTTRAVLEEYGWVVIFQKKSFVGYGLVSDFGPVILRGYCQLCDQGHSLQCLEDLDMPGIASGLVYVKHALQCITLSLWFFSKRDGLLFGILYLLETLLVWKEFFLDSAYNKNL